MKKKVGIISAGAWGTAVAKVLADKGHAVTLWDFIPDVVEDINTKHTNSRFLYGVKLPSNLKATTQLEEAAGGKDFIILATPSNYLLNSVKELVKVHDVMEGKAKIGIITKGFLDAPEVPLLLTDAVENYLPGFYKGNTVYISGPSHAEEVARAKITGLVAASLNEKNAVAFRDLLAGEVLKVDPSSDVIGVQVCASIKNVVAIAYGILDALKEYNDRMGDNTESLLLAAGLKEIQQMGTALGSTDPQTFSSIAGVGDLDVTCKSKYGRNRKFGHEIITDKILDKFTSIEDLMARIKEVGYLPEGVFASYYANKIRVKYDLKLPLVEQVYLILNKQRHPCDAIDGFFG